MKRKQHRHNPVARAVRSGKVARPATHKPSKGGAYQRRPKQRPKNSEKYACHFSDIRACFLRHTRTTLPQPKQMR